MRYTRLLIYFLFSGNLFASGWYDLDNDEQKLYGSEKEEKYVYDLGISYMEKWSDGTHFSHMIFGIYKYTDYPRYRSLRVFPFWYHLSSKIDNRRKTIIPIFLFYSKREFDDQFNISPFYYYERDSYGYDMSILHLYWWGIRKTPVPSNRKYYLLVPLFYHKNERVQEVYRHKKTIVPLLLFYKNFKQYNVNYADNKKKGVGTFHSNASVFHYYSSRKEPAYNELTWWFPLIPFYFYSKDNNGKIHRNLLWITDWNTLDGYTTRFWLMPFLFYDASEDGYRYFFPFYLKPKGWDESQGTTFSLFHYYHWSSQEKTLWILPWFSWKNFSKKGFKKEHFTMVFPVYTSWKFNDSKGNIILPWSMEYRNSRYSLHLNFIGISRSASLHPVLSSNTGVTSQGFWYFDSDVSWLYDVFSIQTRISLKNSTNKVDEKKNHLTVSNVQNRSDIDKMLERGLQEKLEIKHDSNVIKIQSKKELKKEMSITRKKSEFFWGVRIFFGLFSYQMADSKRHFRLLPFTWLSWDKNSSDNLYVIPPVFFKYKSEVRQNDFLIVFPFYGSMNTATYSGRSYLTILYWDEYYRKDERWEKTILWPLINIYKSPKRFGYRIIPIVWHKSFYEGGTVSSRYFTPLFFSYNKKNKKDALSRQLMMNPLYYLSEKKGSTYHSRLFMAPIVPIYIKNQIEKRFEKKEKDNSIFQSFRSEINTLWFPIAYTSRKAHLSPYGDVKRFSVVSPFLFYFQSRTFDKRETTPEIEKKWNFEPYEYQIFLLGYYHANMNGWISNRFLYNFFHYSWNYAKTEKRFSCLFGLYGYKKNKHLNMSYLIPLYYFRKKESFSYDNNKIQSRIFFNPFYYSKYYQKSKSDSNQYLKKNTFWFPIVPLIYMHDSEGSDFKKIRFYSGIFFYESEYHLIQNYFLLYDHSVKVNYDFQKHGFILSLIQYRKSGDTKKYSLFYDFLMNYTYETNEMDYKFRALLSLMRIKHDKMTYRNSFFPLWYYSHYSHYRKFWFTPTLTYMSREYQKKYDLILLGLFYYRDLMPHIGYDQKLWLSGLIWDERRRSEKGYHSMASMWGLLWEYEKESENDFRKFTIFKGLYKMVDTKGTVKRKIFWIIPL